MSCFRVIRALCPAGWKQLQVVNVSKIVIGSRWSLSSAIPALDVCNWKILTRGNAAYAMTQTTLIPGRILGVGEIWEKTFYLLDS